MCCIGCDDFIEICSGFQAAEANIGIQIADVVGLCIRSYGLSCYQLVIAIVNTNCHALQVGRCGSDCSSNRNNIANLDIWNGCSAGDAQGICCRSAAVRNRKFLIHNCIICMCCIGCDDFIEICSGFQAAEANIGIQIADVVGLCIRSYGLSCHQLVIAIVNTNRDTL